MSGSDSSGSDRIRGFLFAREEIAEVEFRRPQASERIGALLGEPPAEPVVLTTGLSAWTGAWSEVHGAVNQPATMVVNGILRAVADGDYGTSLEERARVSGVLAQAGPRPVVRGSCLLLGRREDGSPASVPGGFADWWQERREAWIGELEHRLTILRGQG